MKIFTSDVQFERKQESGGWVEESGFELVPGVLHGMESHHTKPFKSNPEIIFIRQESRVQKIDDENEDAALLKKDNKNHVDNGDLRKNITNLKSCKSVEEDNELNSTKELKVNGNVVIYMPPKDEPGPDLKYKNEYGLEKQVSFDNNDNEESGKLKKGQRFCLLDLFTKIQTWVNIFLAIVCVAAIILATLTYVTKQHVSNDNFLYCYPCDQVENIVEKYRKENMCCISEPVKHLKQGQEEQSSSVDDGHLLYNGSRILEFEADFTRDWSKVNSHNYIRWLPSSNINSSFMSHQNDSGVLSLTYKGTFVITISLTTDTFSANTEKKYVRLMVCLVFTTPGGRKSEECRPITHTKIMNIPFQIVKYKELQKGTQIYATITSREILQTRESHNKLYIVML